MHFQYERTDNMNKGSSLMQFQKIKIENAKSIDKSYTKTCEEFKKTVQKIGWTSKFC